MRKVGLFCMFVLLLGVFMVNGETSQASAAEHGVVLKVDGEASFQKGATSRKIGLKTLDKVQAGDIIYTKKGSSIVLQLSTGDEINISEKSQVYFTVQGNHVYVHVLKGNIFVAAEERVSDDEALYIISGKEKFKVLGTQFFIGINPNTNETFMKVFAGVVSATADEGHTEEFIYPGQEYNPINQETLPIDTGEIVEQISENVIEALLANMQRAREENDKLLKELNNGNAPNFPYLEDKLMDQYENNLKTLLQKVLEDTINSNRVNQEDIQRIIDEAGFKLDKEKADQYMGEITDREREMRKKKQNIREKLREDMREREEQGKREREEQLRKKQELLDAIKNRQSQLEQERNKQKEKAREQARERYERETAPTRPRPVPGPRELGIQIMEVTNNSIMVRLENVSAEDYSVWLENKDGAWLIPGEDINEEHTYSFYELQENTTYVVVVKSGEKEVRESVKTNIKDPEYPENEDLGDLTFNAYMDDTLYLDFAGSGVILNEYEEYLIKVNNKIVDPYKVELADNRLMVKDSFENAFLKIEVSLMKDGNKSEYGYVKIFNNSRPNIDVYDLTSNSATVFLIKSNIEGKDETFNLYKDMELIESNLKDSISGLDPDTIYILKEVLDGVETEEFIEFKTKSLDEDIFKKDFDNQQIYWDEIDRETFMYNVYINGKLIEENQDYSSINYQDIKKINGDLHDIRLVIFDDDDEIKSYEWTFEIFLKPD